MYDDLASVSRHYKYTRVFNIQISERIFVTGVHTNCNWEMNLQNHYIKRHN